jgi:hypothetical protein
MLNFLKGSPNLKPIHERAEMARKSKEVTKTHLAQACGQTGAWYSLMFQKGRPVWKLKTLKITN